MPTGSYQNPCGHFALKTLYSQMEQDFNKELANLNRCASRMHLVELYAAMEHGTEYSFLFPWASGGPLSSLWSKDTFDWGQDGEGDDADLSARTRKAVRWIAQQCCGLVTDQGLGFVHNTTSLERSDYLENLASDCFGIHGDIKPDNILHFARDANEYGSGVLKISDMGLTAFHTKISRSRQLPSGPCSPTYRAPEHGVKGCYLSRKYDVWSIGCVFSELLSWLIRGPEGVKEYQELRYADVLGSVHGSAPREDNFFRYSIRDGRFEEIALKPSVVQV